MQNPLWSPRRVLQLYTPQIAMADYQRPIGDREPPYDPIIVPQVEKDRKAKEELFSGRKTFEQKPLVFATLLSYFKKVLNLFSSKGKTRLLMIDRQQFLEDLLIFRKFLQTLANEDQSHNPDYTKQLAELWHNLIDDFNHVAQFEKKIPKELEKIKNLIDKLHHFPHGEDHTLGYYFAEYAGKDWLPFPFMEILQKLHEDYLATPQLSDLREWINLLNEVIESLDNTTEL